MSKPLSDIDIEYENKLEEVYSEIEILKKQLKVLKNKEIDLIQEWNKKLEIQEIENQK